MQIISNWIQGATGVVALVAAGAALVVSWLDRRESRAEADRDRCAARELAQEDRAAAAHHARLAFELEALTRLAENRNRGGSQDHEERARLGAEALTLVGIVGRERIPSQWDRQVEKSSDELRAHLVDPDLHQWKIDAIEVQLAINDVLGELDRATSRDGS